MRMKIPSSLQEKPLPGAIALGLILIMYTMLYYKTVFTGAPALAINTRPPPDGDGALGALWTVARFFGIYGGPFAFATYYYDKWSLKHSFLVSICVWGLIYFGINFIYGARFSKIYPNSAHCLIVGISTYPIIGINIIAGHFIGSFFKAFKSSSY